MYVDYFSPKLIADWEAVSESRALDLILAIPKDFPYPGVTFLRPAHSLPPAPPPLPTGRKIN